ncbi:MAG: hypothetical protein ACREX0_08600 [Noviherbaspirillum sp.]
MLAIDRSRSPRTYLAHSSNHQFQLFAGSFPSLALILGRSRRGCSFISFTDEMNRAEDAKAVSNPYWLQRKRRSIAHGTAITRCISFNDFIDH